MRLPQMSWLNVASHRHSTDALNRIRETKTTALYSKLYYNIACYVTFTSKTIKYLNYTVGTCSGEVMCSGMPKGITFTVERE